MATVTSAPAGSYDGIALSFKEPMSGYFQPGEPDPILGATRGKSAGTRLSFDVRIGIPDLGRFFRDPRHEAELTGHVDCPALGGRFPIRDGRFELFSTGEAGIRQMIYWFRFDAQGTTYCLSGHKEISDDPARLDLAEDMTRLYTRVHRGPDESGPVYGAGELYFHLKDGPALLASIQVDGPWYRQVGARVAFASFIWGALRDEYFNRFRLFYDTGYENLVLSGTMRSADGAREAPFFFVSGVHDKGFPWGDGELFWDVMLAAGDGPARGYSITDRVLAGLELDLARGVYRYRGPLFRPRQGYAASFSQMRSGAPGLEELRAEIEIHFEAAPFETVPFPFPLMRPVVRKLSSALAGKLRNALPGERPLGIYITPHRVRVRSGSIRIARPGAAGEALEEWRIDADGTLGECERGSFRNLKEPTLLYGYLCAIEPKAGRARVQIASRTLRDERTNWVKDQADRLIGAAVARTGAAEMRMDGAGLTVAPLSAPFRKTGAPVVEVNNDHYPTAVFQRRIVRLEEPPCLALEEDMSLMRLEPIGSERSVKVAIARGGSKFAALDRVLEEAGFDALLEERLRGTGKPRESFSIAIKPNFMFSYDRRDQTTYTDPELVHHLVARLRARGFDSIAVVEAQSTYGEFFERRSVREMAAYLGYDGSAGYQVVDMTLDVDEQRDLGPALGRHPVSRAWRDADFRVSFAKNKTHSYCYYSLTLKNIYGALPLANKFKEYHTGRDIYRTTMEYLAAFPVHFGVIDGWLSADGPFGVFADTAPNQTRTMIAGEDLVAVDWVGATLMGIDPMISPYMQLAVERFGKPEIVLSGEANPYRPWLNVPPLVPLLAHGGIDAEHRFGNLLYMVSAQMDESHFRHKNNAWHVRLLRRFTLPVRRAFFVRSGENPSAFNRFFSWLFYRLGY